MLLGEYDNAQVNHDNDYNNKIYYNNILINIYKIIIIKKIFFSF